MKKQVHVHYIDKQWVVYIGTKAVSKHNRKVFAHNAGRKLATAARTELCIHHKWNGKIIRKDSFGNDPRKIKG
jgi:DNA/RNA endonuclease G (NUC1)